MRILDVRPAAEFERGHLPGASRLAPEEFALPYLRPPRRRTLVVTAAEPAAARSAARSLRVLGYTAIPLDAPLSRWCGPWETGPERIPSWEPSALLRRHHPRPSHGRAAVDLACGSGRDAVYLSLRGFEVTGIDRLPDALAQGEHLARRHGVRIRWIRADLERDPATWTGPWDLIHVHRFLDRTGLRLLSGRLADCGRLFVETYLDQQTSTGRRPRDPRHLLRRGELWGAVRDLDVVQYLEGIDPDGDWTAAVAARSVRRGLCLEECI